jgi:hypothetical protein
LHLCLRKGDKKISRKCLYTFAFSKYPQGTPFSTLFTLIFP